MDPRTAIEARLTEMDRPVKYPNVKAASMATDPDSGHTIVTVKLPDGSVETTVIRADDLDAGNSSAMVEALETWVSEVAPG